MGILRSGCAPAPTCSRSIRTATQRWSVVYRRAQSVENAAEQPIAHDNLRTVSETDSPASCRDTFRVGEGHENGLIRAETHDQAQYLLVGLDENLLANR